MARRERPQPDTPLEAAVQQAGQVVGWVEQQAYRAARRTVRTLVPRRPARRADMPSGPGAPPGLTPEQLAAMAHEGEPAPFQLLDFGPDVATTVEGTGAKALRERLDEDRPAGATVRWINVDATSEPAVLAELAERYGLHPLTMEDVMSFGQRPKLEHYPPPATKEGDAHSNDRHLDLFIVLRMVYRDGRPTDEQAKPKPGPTPGGAGLSSGGGGDRAICSEQVSMFLGEDTLLTIQQRPGDVWKQVRQRLDRQGTRLRAGDASFLMYALLDAVVDAVFEVLDAYAERIEHLEDQLLDHPEQTGIDPVRSLRRELTLLRRQLFPMRELITQLEQLDDPRVGDEARLYLRDVHDHVVQALDLLETYHELGQGLADTWMNAMSTRMNEVMKVLTIVASLFIPISFLAGVFGMNFERIPGLHHPAAFVFFCCGCLGIVFGMLWFFRRRGWL